MKQDPTSHTEPRYDVHTLIFRCFSPFWCVCVCVLLWPVLKKVEIKLKLKIV